MKANKMYKYFEKTTTPLLKALTWNDGDPEHEEAMLMLSETPLKIKRIKQQYEIILSYGMPKCQISGKLDNHNEPETANFQVQDWNTDWTAAADQDENMLLQFARLFHYNI